MSNHLGDTNKMVSDTPRTDDAQWGTGKVTTDFARQLERELNAANKRLEEIETSGVHDGRPIDKTYLTIHSDALSTMVSEKAYDPQATIRELQDRIKRLEEAGDEMADAYEEICHDSYDQKQIANWRKAREAKL